MGGLEGFHHVLEPRGGGLDFSFITDDGKVRNAREDCERQHLLLSTRKYGKERTLKKGSDLGISG